MVVVFREEDLPPLPVDTTSILSFACLRKKGERRIDDATRSFLVLFVIEDHGGRGSDQE